MNFRFILILKTELLVYGREPESMHKVNKVTDLRPEIT